MTGLHSTWLMPAPPHEAEFQAIIDGLAVEFARSRFRPHLTLAEEVRRGADDLAGLLHEASRGVGPFEAVIGAVDLGEQFFRCLYARFPSSAPLSTLRNGIARHLSLNGSERFMPHISLLYGVEDSAAKRAVRDRIAPQLIGKRIRFDRICIAASAKEIPVEAWEVRETIPLSP